MRGSSSSSDIYSSSRSDSHSLGRYDDSVFERVGRTCELDKLAIVAQFHFRITYSAGGTVPFESQCRARLGFVELERIMEVHEMNGVRTYQWYGSVVGELKSKRLQFQRVVQSSAMT